MLVDVAVVLTGHEYWQVPEQDLWRVNSPPRPQLLQLHEVQEDHELGVSSESWRVGYELKKRFLISINEPLNS